MNLSEYLKERHPTVNALTRSEAKIVGINYPLERGWVLKYGDLELPIEILEKLRLARAERYLTAAYKKAKAKSKKKGSAPMKKVTKRQKISYRKRSPLINKDVAMNINHFKSV